MSLKMSRIPNFFHQVIIKLILFEEVNRKYIRGIELVYLQLFSKLGCNQVEVKFHLKD